MTRWIRTLRFDDLPTDRGAEFVAEGRIFAIFRADDEAYAMDGMCCHQGGPLGKAKRDGFVVKCPWHGWPYDVRTGIHQVTPSIRQPTFPTRVVDGWVEVEIEG